MDWESSLLLSGHILVIKFQMIPFLSKVIVYDDDVSVSIFFANKMLRRQQAKQQSGLDSPRRKKHLTMIQCGRFGIEYIPMLHEKQGEHNR